MAKRKRYLYHVTPSENVPRILHEGLTRDGSGRRSIGIYLSENPFSWFVIGYTILRVDMSGLYKLADVTTSLPDLDEIIYWGDIPATKKTKNGSVPRITVLLKCREVMTCDAQND